MPPEIDGEVGAGTTVVIVVYKTKELHLNWIPADSEIVIVHNDDVLDEASLQGRNVKHICPQSNVGFGAGVNLAAKQASGSRLILCNPDVFADSVHWDLLRGGENEVVTTQLVDGSGAVTVSVAPYYNACSLLLTGLRVGRYFPAHGIVRRSLSKLGLPAFSASSTESRSEWTLGERWASGAFVSIPTDKFLGVGGFDEGYFLYFEDVDLFRRLSHRFPDMTIRCATPPARHLVGASSDASNALRIKRERLSSAIRYGRTMDGVAARIVGLLLSGRLALMGNDKK